MVSCSSSALWRRGVAAFVTAAMVLGSTPVPSLAEAELDPEPVVQEAAEGATEEQQAEVAVEESAVTAEDVAEPEAAAEDGEELVAEPEIAADDVEETTVVPEPAAEPTLDEQVVEAAPEEEALLSEASTTQFPDVPSTYWAANYISQAVERGIISGYANGYFGPDNKVTRGQLAVMFWKKAGRPKAGAGAKNFPDVKPGKYYYEAVRWVSARGLINGYKNGNFGPNDFVTREQLAVICTNYVRRPYYWLLYDDASAASNARAYLANMSDADSVSSWALVSVYWCKRNGLITGKANNTLLDPQGPATRAETVKVLVRLDDRIYDLLT